MTCFVHITYGEGQQTLLMVSNSPPLFSPFKMIDHRPGDSEMSPNQYAQLLGHTTQMMGASYVSPLSAIDVQALVNHEKVRRDHIQILRSMRLHIRLDLPIDLPFSESMKLLQHEELIKRDEELRVLEEKLDDENSTLQAQYVKQSLGRKHCLERLYRSARHAYRTWNITCGVLECFHISTLN